MIAMTKTMPIGLVGIAIVLASIVNVIIMTGVIVVVLVSAHVGHDASRCVCSS